MSWSRQTPMKSKYMISTTGRMPAIAAPTAVPTTALSRDRRVANATGVLLGQPAGEAEDVAARADVDTGDEDVGVVLRARVRARRGPRPSFGRSRPSAPVARRSGSRGNADVVVERVSATGSVGGRTPRRRPSRSPPRPRSSRSVDDGGVELLAGRARSAGRASSTPRARRPRGSSPDRLRSARASGRSPPRPGPDRRRCAGSSTIADICCATATTSLPSTAAKSTP